MLRVAHADSLLIIIAGENASSLLLLPLIQVCTGSDTTGSVLANLVFLMLTEPGLKSWRRLQSDLDQAYADMEDLSGNQLAEQVPFLDCCLNEAMR